MAILDENEFTEVDGRSYLNPQIALDESNTFIDNLRSTQEANNQQIKMDTYNLGTDVPSNLGGLTGAESYFAARYQTPQTKSAVADLRSAAQAAALNQALQNEQDIWKKKYNDTYRKYQKSAYDKENTPTTVTGDPVKDGETETTYNNDDQGSSSNVSTINVDDSQSNWIEGKGENVISWEIDGKTYYGNVYYQTGFAQDRYTGLDTSNGMSFSGQSALDFLNGIVERGGKIYNSSGQEITPYQALTGGTTSGRW